MLPSDARRNLTEYLNHKSKTLSIMEDYSFYFRRYLFWVNDNIGNGDGSQFILEIWKDDPELAKHLSSKWRQTVRGCAAEVGLDPTDGWPVQQLALQRFLLSLSPENLEAYLTYAVKNGRWG